MTLQDFLDFLTSDNRDRLTWIGSGIAAVAGAVWIVAKSLLKRRLSGAPMAPNASANPNASSVDNFSNFGNQTNIGNVGGNVSVVQTIGATISKIAAVVLIIGLLLVAIAVFINWFISSGAEAAALPQVEFTVGCGDDDASVQTVLPATPDEAKSLSNLLKVGFENQGEIIFAKVDVNKPCGLCECYRLDERNSREGKRAKKYDSTNTLGYVEMSWAEEWENIPATKGNLMITTMIYDDMAATHSFFLPAADQIPRNELYTNNTIRSTVIAYSGPFYIEANYDTGWGYVKLTPLTVVDDNIRRRLRCSQPNLSWVAKLLDRCAPKPQPVAAFDDVSGEGDNEVEMSTE